MPAGGCGGWGLGGRACLGSQRASCAGCRGESGLGGGEPYLWATALHLLCLLEVGLSRLSCPAVHAARAAQAINALQYYLSMAEVEKEWSESY